MENHSFNHILGWIYLICRDIDGLTGKESNRLNAFDPSSQKIFITDEVGCVDSYLGHDFEDIHEQIFGSTDTSNVLPPWPGLGM